MTTQKGQYTFIDDINYGNPVLGSPTVSINNPLDPRIFVPIIWKHSRRFNFIDRTDLHIDCDTIKALSPMVKVGNLDFSHHSIGSYKDGFFDLMPDCKKGSKINSWCNIDRLNYLFEQAVQDTFVSGEINSLKYIIPDTSSTMPDLSLDA